MFPQAAMAAWPLPAQRRGVRAAGLSVGRGGAGYGTVREVAGSGPFEALVVGPVRAALRRYICPCAAPAVLMEGRELGDR
jgi:hypothetical protein